MRNKELKQEIKELKELIADSHSRLINVENQLRKMSADTKSVNSGYAPVVVTRESFIDPLTGFEYITHNDKLAEVRYAK